jgi:futalosine hydrolase
MRDTQWRMVGQDTPTAGPGTADRAANLILPVTGIALYTSDMDHAPRILILAATDRELAAPQGWIAALCGVGPVEAAVSAAVAIAEYRPDAVIQVGIAGARRSANLAPATLVIGSESQYCDLADLPAAWATASITANPVLVAALQRHLPGAVTRPIGTSGRVGGSSACEVEAMEGFGVLRAAQRANVPAIEIRAISNDIEEQDRARWHFQAAFNAITSVTPLVVKAVQEALHHA